MLQFGTEKSLLPGKKNEWLFLKNLKLPHGLKGRVSKDKFGGLQDV